MGHCKHQWQERSEVLREVFSEAERRKHVFYVCTRCMKIDEVPAPAVPLERSAAAPPSLSPAAEGERAA